MYKTFKEIKESDSVYFTDISKKSIRTSLKDTFKVCKIEHGGLTLELVNENKFKLHITLSRKEYSSCYKNLYAFVLISDYNVFRRFYNRWIIRKMIGLNKQIKDLRELLENGKKNYFTTYSKVNYEDTKTMQELSELDLVYSSKGIIYTVVSNSYCSSWSNNSHDKVLKLLSPDNRIIDIPMCGLDENRSIKFGDERLFSDVRLFINSSHKHVGSRINKLKGKIKENMYCRKLCKKCYIVE